jgi:hypothetical protein
LGIKEMKVMVLEEMVVGLVINLEEVVDLDKVDFKIKDLVVVVDLALNKVLGEDSINNLEIKVLVIIRLEEAMVDLIISVVKIIKEYLLL